MSQIRRRNEEIIAMRAAMFFDVLNEKGLSDEKIDELGNILLYGDYRNNEEVMKYLEEANERLEELYRYREANKPKENVVRESRPRRIVLSRKVKNMFFTILEEYGLDEDKIDELGRILASGDFRDNQEVMIYLDEAYKRCFDIIESRNKGLK